MAAQPSGRPLPVNCRSGRDRPPAPSGTAAGVATKGQRRMESSVSIELAKHVLMVFGLILMLGTFCGLLARLTKVPDVVVFLLVGMLIGPGVLGWVDIKADFDHQPADPDLRLQLHPVRRRRLDPAQGAEGSLDHRRWSSPPIGVLITAAITGVAAYYILGVPLIVALLLGATLASTDPATLVPVFKQMQDQGTRGADRDERIRLQRCDGRHRHLYRARRGDGRGRILRRRCACSICSSNRCWASSSAACWAIWPPC